MRYRLYLFDFDYTLVDSSRAILKCFHLTLDALGYPDASDDTIRHTIGLPMLDAIRIVAGLGDVPDDDQDLQTFLQTYRGNADKYMTAGTHFFPHTVATLHALRDAGARLGIISSKTSYRIADKFHVAGEDGLIDLIIGSDTTTTHKPDPEGLLMAIGHFGVERADVLYTGDSYVDAGAAQNAGVDFAAVTTGTTTAADFARYPSVAIMPDIAELRQFIDYCGQDTPTSIG